MDTPGEITAAERSLLARFTSDTELTATATLEIAGEVLTVQEWVLQRGLRPVGWTPSAEERFRVARRQDRLDLAAEAVMAALAGSALHTPGPSAKDPGAPSTLTPTPAPSPVRGWSAAARTLGISTDTLAKTRRLRGVTGAPYWATPGDCVAWWRSVVRAVQPLPPPPPLPAPAPPAPRRGSRRASAPPSTEGLTYVAGYWVRDTK